jgi:hypothetical protein
MGDCSADAPGCKIGCKDFHVKGYGPTILAVRACGLSYVTTPPGVNPQAKIFSCENNRLTSQIPLPERTLSITLEGSS